MLQNYIIQLPEKLDQILSQDQTIHTQYLSVIKPFSEILQANKMPFFPEFTDHGINHIEASLAAAENLIADETLEKMTPEEVGVMVLSFVLHDIGMLTNAEMFKNMMDGAYDNLANLSLNGKPWKELWKDYLYDSQYWGEKKKNDVFGNPNYNIKEPNLEDLQGLTNYDKKLIGEFIRIHHCRLAHEVSLNGYIGGNGTIHFRCDDIDPEYIKMAGIVARSHGMDIRDTFDYLESEFGDIENTLGVHAVYLMALLRLSDYLQIDKSRTNGTMRKIDTMYSPFSRLEHETHQCIQTVQFKNTDKEKIAIHATPKDARIYVKIENLANDIQREFDRSWAILGEAYPDHNYKLRYRRITTNISNEKFKNHLTYVPEQFGFRYNNDLFKLLIAPLYGDNPSYGVRELVQNAVDACRLCLNDIPDDNKPYVKVEVDSKKRLFTITDRGKGMNLYEIRNYFLTIGSSYNDNIDWKKARDQQHLYRTGRFGIGVLAAFLLGPEITVVTKKRNEATGYRFTASMNESFIQIEKEPTAEYGTKIEIICTAECMEKLGNSYYGEWYSWYIGNKPQVEYYYDGERKIPKIDLAGYKELMHTSDKYGTVLWKPLKLDEIVMYLYCNGFSICRNRKDFSLNDFNLFEHIRFIPHLIITDTYNQLPLNLQRNDIDDDAYFDFEPELAREVFIDTMCQLMAITIIEKKEFLTFHADGFSLNSEYVTQCIKEKSIIYVCYDYRYSSRYSRYGDKKYYEFKFLKKNGYCIRYQGDTELIDKFRRYVVDILGEDKMRLGYSRRESEKRLGYLRRNLERFLDYDCFAVEDDNAREKQLLKQYFPNALHNYGQWLIYAHGNPERKKILEDVITNCKDETINFIFIKDIEKKTVPKTIIDELFDKYMHRDPIVPYEMEERKKKFPRLFQDYSDLIEHYLSQE